METKHGTKYRQLHIEDYLREIPAEQGRGTGVYAMNGLPGTLAPTRTFGRTNCLILFSGATISTPHTRE